jgi:membrane protein insertase Oxa1/YidC/SpoIIIJ
MNEATILIPFFLLFLITIIIGVVMFIQSWFHPQQFLDKMKKRGEKFPQMEILFRNNIILWFYRIASVLFLLMTLLAVLTLILSLFFDYPPVS